MGVTLAVWDEPRDRGSFRFVWANGAARTSVGVPAERWLGLTLREAFSDLMDGKLPDAYVEAMTTQQSLNFDRLDYHVDGVRTVFDLNLVPLSNDLLGIFYEPVTELVVAEEERDRVIAELARSNQDLDEFAYVASHDLKAPLRDIENLANWIAEDVGDALPKQSAQMLDRLRERTSRMQRLLEALLGYARACETREPTASFDLDELLRDVVAFCVVPEGFEVVLPAATGVQLECPRPLLHQVLLNLVGNALKHHGGARGVVRIHASVVEGWVRIEVCDDGQGIPQKYHGRIFELFQTLRPRDEVEGSGMGLAFVKKVVTSQGGTVRVESSDGRGATFSFSWPLVWTPTGGQSGTAPAVAAAPPPDVP